MAKQEINAHFPAEKKGKREKPRIALRSEWNDSWYRCEISTLRLFRSMQVLTSWPDILSRQIPFIQKMQQAANRLLKCQLNGIIDFNSILFLRDYLSRLVQHLKDLLVYLSKNSLRRHFFYLFFFICYLIEIFILSG